MMVTVGDRLARRSFIWVAAVGVASLSSIGAHAQTPEADVEDALGLVKDTTQRLLKAVNREEAIDAKRAFDLVAEYISPHVDLERSARWILGRHWREATEDQRRRFVAEFRTLLLRTYAIAVAENPQVSIEYLPVRRTKRPREAIVKTRIPQTSAPPIAVNYRLHDGKQGWKLFDVSIEGISLVKTYRSSFSQRVKKKGMDALIKDMAAKNLENAGA
ncbi:MAG: ABC transporter substrate-binding protein [Chromatiales bacterium]|jgi:phospholipid transport system substrate-binding protein|nr:ABC transporter substrate-binding protein [Chromatiales bacterium]